MKKIITLMVFLGLVSAISGGLLAAVNEVTAPIINGLAIEKEKANLELIFPNTSYEALTIEDETGLVTGAYLAKDQGYIFKSEVKGYSSTPIIFMIGVDNEGVIKGFKILSHAETSGIGSRIETEEYVSVVTGKTASDTIDTLAGATVSTKAVRSGIDAAFTVYNNLLGLAPVEKTNEPETPKVETNTAEIVSNNEGTYIVESKGFSAINEITVITKEGLIESVTISAFNDVLADGTSVFPEAYFTKFAGLNVSEITSDFDVVTGATMTSKAVLNAVMKVAEQEQSALGKTEDETSFTYVIEGEGYSFDKEGINKNIFKIVINKSDNSILGVEVVKFNDTLGLGDKATTPEHLAKFVGKTEDTLAEVDTVAGATMTANSIVQAINSAFSDMKGGQ